jgi:uncharacterized protein (TIGR03083 family)
VPTRVGPKRTDAGVGVVAENSVDDLAMMWEEVADIGDLLHELDDGDFDTPSLCDGWAIRDVIGHMGTGHTTPFPGMMTRIAKHGFNVTKASYTESRHFLAGKSADEIRTFWDSVMITEHPRKGISKLIPGKAAFLDHLVHNQDMRRPTGKRREIPEYRLRRALELVRTEGNPMFNPKKNVAGLRLVATDIDWTGGDGPTVEGPGEAIVVAGAGRRAALDDLSGDGVAVLRTRFGA